MRTESDRHQEAVEYISKLFNGVGTDKEHRRLHGYYPDVKTNDTDIEIECYSKNHHIIGKVRRWNSNKKKILILTLPKEIENIFDEVYLLSSNNNLVKSSKI